MIKSLVLFFRRRAIKKNIQQKRRVKVPEVNKFPVVTMLIDESQKRFVKDLEMNLKTLFNPKTYRFVIVNDVVPENCLCSDQMMFVTKGDFNVLGLLNKEKTLMLKSFADDIFIDMSESQNCMENDYLVSMVNSAFKIGSETNNSGMYDMTLNYGIEKNNVERLKIIKKYLLMLSGN